MTRANTFAAGAPAARSFRRCDRSGQCGSAVGEGDGIPSRARPAAIFSEVSR